MMGGLYRSRCNWAMARESNTIRMGKRCTPDLMPSEIGTSAGINIAPGSEDDGWVVPQPVQLGDGTRIQYYKDGEALHAGFDAIRDRDVGRDQYSAGERR